MTEPIMQLGDPSPEPVEIVAVPEGVAVKLEIDVATNQFRYVALSDAELAQRVTDQAAAVAAAKVDAQETAERDALVAKLTAGTATDAETQQALAHLLGGGA